MRNSGTLIVSISGIRGIFGDGLDPSVLVKYAAAFGTWCRRRAEAIGQPPVVVIGRDARRSGPVCAQIVAATLRSAGCNVIDAGLAPTPTVEMAVLAEQAAGGIVLSASHNPAEWNALKLLNEKGEFLSADEGQAVIDLADHGGAETVAYDALGTYRTHDFLPYHIEQILRLDFIDPEAIARQDVNVVVDGINSVGGVAIPQLLRHLGVRDENIVVLNGDPTGEFAHPAEPLPEHVTGLTAAVKEQGADLGIAVDPDADRLALVDNEGRYILEELTQVIAADFLWGFRDGPFVTNLSSSRAIDDVAERHGQSVYRSAVGEINVVKKMQAVDATLGGEGNGGVILPDLHYGRDALVGTAMVLQHLANEQTTLAEVHDALPHYAIVKDKLPLDGLDVDRLLQQMERRYQDADDVELSTVDGVKISFPRSWVHLRASNTEPILRIYAEAATADEARSLAARFKEELLDEAARTA
jgi:phosphomannomutase